jgi:hypothetical protein
MLPSQLFICCHCHQPTHVISAPGLNQSVLLILPDCLRQKRTANNKSELALQAQGEKK